MIAHDWNKRAHTPPSRKTSRQILTSALRSFCAEFAAHYKARKMGRLMTFILLLSVLIIKLSALTLFPDKFRLGEKYTTVTLDCKTNKESVTWKREDTYGAVDVEESEFEQPNGTKLIVYELQEDQTGNYTCWSAEGLEDYTYLLLDKSKEAAGFDINCVAETFSCTETLKCTWTSADYTAFRLRNTRDNGSWLSQSVDGLFHVPHATNSYSEESERLLITGEAVSSCCYITTELSFYLRDIIKPAGPNVSVCSQRRKKPKVDVEVTPPSTWPQPHSFFPLKHQIEYQMRDDGRLKTFEWEGSKVEVHGLITRLRVRSRDPLLRSEWSEWTPWKHVPCKGKGKRTKPKKKSLKKDAKGKKCRKNQQTRSKTKHPTWAKF